MTAGELAAWAQAAFGFGAFAAACVAVKAAYDAPRLAAEFAERLRKASAAAEENERQKLGILRTLLQHRATFEFPDAVNALNMIAIVFVDDQEVRDAYTHFLSAAETGQGFDAARLKERYLQLIEKIVRSVGLADKIKVADVHQGYYPTFLAKQRLLVSRDVEERFAAAFPDATEDQGRANGA